MEMLHELPVTTMIYDGVEADDVMAYIPTKILKEDEQAVVMSTDKDFLQLLMIKLSFGLLLKRKIYNQNRIKEEFGLDPKNLLTL
jgi:5'-3' exonuclease